METAKNAAASGVSGKASSGKASLKLNPDDEPAERRSSHARGKNEDSKLSHDGGHSSLSRRVSSSSRSKSQSYSVSRSPSRSPPVARRHISRSLSRSPRPRRRSRSPLRRVRSPVYSPRRKRSPLYPRSPRRRSRSPWRRRSPSPPRRRRSPPPRRRRSPSPPRRRRSPSPPLRRRSPVPASLRRSPAPLSRRRTPPLPRRRSPSPLSRRMSLSPLPRRRSMSPPSRRSPASPASKRSLTPPSRRSSSPARKLRSPAPRSPRHRKQSPVRSPRRRQMEPESPSQRKRNNRNLGKEHSSYYADVEPRIYQDRNASEKAQAKRSSGRDYLDREENELKQQEHGCAGGRDIVETSHFFQNSPIRSHSPQRDARIRSKGPSNIPDLSSPYQSSPSQSPSREYVLKMNKTEEKGRSPYRRNVVPTRDSPEPSKIPEQNTRFDRVEMPSRRDIQALHASEIKDYGPKRSGHGRDSLIELPDKRTGEKHSRHEVSEPKRKQYHTYGSGSVDHSSDYPQKRRDIDKSYTPEGIEYGPGISDLGNNSPDHLVNRSGGNRVGTVLRSHIEYGNEEDVVGSRRSPSRDSYADYDGNTRKVDAVHKPIPKLELVKHAVHSGSDSEEDGVYRRKQAEKRKAKRDELGGKCDDEDGNMSPKSSDEKREVKRRRKEEKRLRKEEKRRRREERHRRREERRASKAKAKALATMEGDSSAAEESDDDPHDRDRSHHNYDEEMEDEQKRLEIELRRKALESLRAKKAISH